MKIINLKVQNIKKLVAVDITPDRNVMKISGKNAAGKTSLMDAIWWALGGTKNVQGQPIRQGQSTASINIDLGDLHIERKFTARGSTLFVTDTNGTKLKAPQAILDKLLGQLSFDPLAFQAMDAKSQLSYLKNMVGLDFTDLDDKRTRLFNRRTDANRTMSDLEGQRNGLTLHPDTPLDTIKVTDLMSELKEMNKLSKRLFDSVSRGTVIKAERTTITEKVTDLHKQLKALEAEELAIKRFHDDHNVLDVEQIILSLEERINNAETLNGHLRVKTDIETLDSRINAGNEIIAEFTDSLAAIDQMKVEQLAAAEFPINGLAFNDESVMFNGIPFEQASFAEQLKVSTAMAMALNPELKVIRITDGSMLDSDSMALLERIAEKHDFQIWIEVVDDTGTVGVYIEDGTVVAHNSEEDAA